MEIPLERLSVVVRAGWCVILLAMASLALTAADLPPLLTSTNTVPAKPAGEESAEAQQMLRSHLQLQEQLHATLLAIEQTRLENSTAARTNSEALAGRLELIEKSLAQAREQQADAMRNSNRTMLTLAGIFVGVGFLTLLFMAFFQLRGMNRLAEIATGLPGGNALGPAPFAALGAGDGRLLASGGDSPRSSRLHGVIERLEQRIEELEGAALAPGVTGLPQAEPKVVLLEADEPWAGHLAVLLGKGQTLLKLGQGEGALQCFEEALALAPDNAEVHVKRGTALERLKRFDDAIVAYDRAITLNRQLTQAYLGKGSVFNQQERYSEALECYEQALKTEPAR